MQGKAQITDLALIFTVLCASAQTLRVFYTSAGSYAQAIN